MKYFGAAFAIALGWYCGKAVSEFALKKYSERNENR